MKRIELLIEEARRTSLNKEYSTTIGISQEEFLRYSNEAQRILFREIIKVNPNFFNQDLEESAVAGQEEYALSSKIHAGRIERVEFSSTGQAKDYYELDKRSIQERSSYVGGNPIGYIRRGKSILLQPTPQTGSPGKVRYTFVEKPKELQIRRGKVSAVTDSGTQVTALTILASDLATLDPGGELSKHNYLTIVDRDGVVKMAGIEYDSINTGTGVVTLSAHTYSSGEAIAVNDWVIIGANSTNSSALEDEDVDDYLVNYMVHKALARDNSALGQVEKAKSDELLISIVESFADDGDVMEIPILQIDDMDMG